MAFCLAQEPDSRAADADSYHGSCTISRHPFHSTASMVFACVTASDLQDLSAMMRWTTAALSLAANLRCLAKQLQRPLQTHPIEASPDFVVRIDLVHKTGRLLAPRTLRCLRHGELGAAAALVWLRARHRGCQHCRLRFE